MHNIWLFFLDNYQPFDAQTMDILRHFVASGEKIQSHLTLYPHLSYVKTVRISKSLVGGSGKSVEHQIGLAAGLVLDGWVVSKRHASPGCGICAQWWFFIPPPTSHNAYYRARKSMENNLLGKKQHKLWVLDLIIFFRRNFHSTGIFISEIAIIENRKSLVTQKNGNCLYHAPHCTSLPQVFFYAILKTNSAHIVSNMLSSPGFWDKRVVEHGGGGMVVRKITVMWESNVRNLFIQGPAIPVSGICPCWRGIWIQQKTCYLRMWSGRRPHKNGWVVMKQKGRCLRFFVFQEAVAQSRKTRGKCGKVWNNAKCEEIWKMRNKLLPLGAVPHKKKGTPVWGHVRAGPSRKRTPLGSKQISEQKGPPTLPECTRLTRAQLDHFEWMTYFPSHNRRENFPRLIWPPWSPSKKNITLQI